MTVFHLVRHGSADVPPGVLAGRRPGAPLQPSGRDQAECSAARLARNPVHAIYTSPLDRTQQTAQIIAERLNLRPQIEPALLEVDFGDWTGGRYQEFDPAGPWRRFNTFRSGTRIPGGELMLQTQTRIVQWLIDRRDRSPEDTIVVVSHGDVIRSALVYFLGIPIDLMLRLEVSPGSISTLQIGPDDARAVVINWVGYPP